MASHAQKIILLALILAIAVPISKCGEEESSRRLEDLCSETNRSSKCRNILKSNWNRFNLSDDRAVAGVVVALAIAKSEEIYDEIYRHHLDSGDEWLKSKYLSCAINFYDANCNLEMARRTLDFDEFPDISDDVDDVEEKVMSCRREFREESLDPGRAGDSSEEIGLYLEMIRAAVGRVPKEEEEALI
ncbi:hypothetical protein SASPL_141990 [Salvia splendens]|uniref:Pectinesterase inhibitor domain-containing protein n=1 Tax=Salvia splendens TaxID=180675 RepID=A0A8X8WJE7_SALSN|nr:hypothetical protein SASPL_141990 [Salvia splendens]